MTIDWSKAPEGATHYDPVDQNFLREVGPALLIYHINVGWVVPHHCQYAHTVEDTVRPLMIRPAWNGEGRPPVGTVCEVIPCNTLWGFSVLDTYTGIILAYHADFVWVDLGVPGLPVTTRIDKVDFRLIRTAEQIEADQKKQEIQELMIILGSVESAAYKDIAIAIQQANFRKQVTQ